MRPRFSWFNLVVVAVLLIALLTAVFAPESGNPLDGAFAAMDRLIAKYREYWPSLSSDWEEKLRRSKESIPTVAPPPETEATTAP